MSSPPSKQESRFLIAANPCNRVNSLLFSHFQAVTERGKILKRGAKPLLNTPTNDLYGKGWHLVVECIRRLRIILETIRGVK